MQVGQRGERHARGADLHAGAGDGIQHPGRHDRDHAGGSLDMDDLTRGAPLAVLTRTAADRADANGSGPRSPARYGQNDPVMAVGRKNWTFAGSDRGGERAAAIYTLIETCKLNGVDPQAWLADVLARLPDHPAKRIDELLPWSWSPRRADRRTPEGLDQRQRVEGQG